MILRRFDEDDEPSVVALWTSVFGYSTAHNDPATVIRCKREVQPELFFVAVLDDLVVGTVMGGYDGHRGWIYALAVCDKARGQGIGTALVRHMEQALKERGCLKINLQVLASNAEPVRFYEQLGYAVEPRISMGKIV